MGKSGKDSEAIFYFLQIHVIYFPEIEIHAAQRSQTWCALYLGQSNKKKPQMRTDTVSKLIWNLKKYLLTEKKPKLIGLNVLGILPMTLGIKVPSFSSLFSNLERIRC